MKKRAYCLFLALTLTAASVVGCGSSSSSSGAASSAAGGSTETGETTSAAAGTSAAVTSSSGDGSTFTYAIGAQCKTLDPGVSSYLSSSSVLMNLFMGLEMVGDDGKSIVPGCA